jgi:hypothetical protein
MTTLVCLRSSVRCRVKPRIHGVTDMRSISKTLACLCLLLTLWSATEFVTHHHSNQREASACQICVAAHSTALTFISHASYPVFRTVLTLRLLPTAAKKRLVAFGLYVRPPPSA